MAEGHAPTFDGLARGSNFLGQRVSLYCGGHLHAVSEAVLSCSGCGDEHPVGRQA